MQNTHKPVSSTHMVLLLFKALIPNKGKNNNFLTIYGYTSIFGTEITLEFEGRQYVISKCFTARLHGFINLFNKMQIFISLKVNIYKEPT